MEQRQVGVIPRHQPHRFRAGARKLLPLVRPKRPKKQWEECRALHRQQRRCWQVSHTYQCWRSVGSWGRGGGRVGYTEGAMTFQSDSGESKSGQRRARSIDRSRLSREYIYIFSSMHHRTCWRRERVGLKGYGTQACKSDVLDWCHIPSGQREAEIYKQKSAECMMPDIGKSITGRIL